MLYVRITEVVFEKYYFQDKQKFLKINSDKNAKFTKTRQRKEHKETEIYLYINKIPKYRNKFPFAEFQMRNNIYSEFTFI